MPSPNSLRRRWLRWRLRNITIVQGQAEIREVPSDDPSVMRIRVETPMRIEVEGRRVPKRLVRRLVEKHRV